MTIQEIRQLTLKKLWVKIREMRRELAALRFHAATGQNQDTAKVSKAKKTIARMLAVAQEKQVVTDTQA